MKKRGIVLDRSLKMSRGSRLKLRLLVFENWSSMNRFWKNNLRAGGLDRRTLGVVQTLSREISYKRGQEGKSRIVHHPTYFALMGLLKSHLAANVIAHESVHAGFAYAKRLGGRVTWDGQALEFDEEAVAYPTGNVARLVNDCLYHAGLLQ